MARSRHGRTGGGPPADAGLPAWARRHLDEAGESSAAPSTAVRHHRRGAAAEPSRLRGWGVAIVSVAAAVGAVPLAITTLANDHSDDPLPKVDTYTAGSPGPLQADGGAARAPRAPEAAPGAAEDPSTAGVLQAPPGVAGVPAPGRVVAGPVPAALVRATPTVTPAPVVAKPTTPTTATKTTGEGRSATKTPKPQPTGGNGGGNNGGSNNGGSNNGGGNNGGGNNGGGNNGGGNNGGGNDGGVLGPVLDTGGKVVGGVARTANGAVNGLLGD